LQHPATLLSILLLLINDHVLKIVNPSWLTGKLSDFVGLFFFPFIVAAGLSILLSRFDLKPRLIGQVAFAFVAMWFFFLKTFPYINSLTSQFASSIVGFPTQFILDWTDLIGLIAMLPAWKIWDQSHQWGRSKFAYITLSVGMLASIATSPAEQTVYSVTDLTYTEDGIIYAADKEGYTEEWFPVAISQDGGITWERSYSDNDDMQYIDKKNYPIEYCKYIDYYEVTHCYRVTANLSFVYGFNYPKYDKPGSYSWSPVFDSGDIQVKAYDMIVFPCEDKECILIAAGEAGVLRRVLSDGNWEIINVLGAHTYEVFNNDPK
jgi:hypothetical protein